MLKETDPHNLAMLDQLEQERWRQEQIVLRRAAEARARLRNEVPAHLPVSGRARKFDQLAEALDDPSKEVRNEAVRALYELDADRAASFFNVALREGSSTERRNIGAALAGSGLVDEAIQDLMGESPENSYSAFSFLFLVAKAGEIQPLVEVIKNHSSIELRFALIKLLASSGEREIIPALELLVASDLPAELKAAIREAISKIRGQQGGAEPS